MITYLAMLTDAGMEACASDEPDPTVYGAWVPGIPCSG